MIEYKIKKEYKNQLVIKQTKFGSISFDTSVNRDYEFYYNNGFSEVFEEIEIIKPKPLKYKGIDKTKNNGK